MIGLIMVLNSSCDRAGSQWERKHLCSLFLEHLATLVTEFLSWAGTLRLYKKEMFTEITGGEWMTSHIPVNSELYLRGNADELCLQVWLDSCEEKTNVIYFTQHVLLDCVKNKAVTHCLLSLLSQVQELLLACSIFQTLPLWESQGKGKQEVKPGCWWHP